MLIKSFNSLRIHSYSINTFEWIASPSNLRHPRVNNTTPNGRCTHPTNIHWMRQRGRAFLQLWWHCLYRRRQRQRRGRVSQLQDRRLAKLQPYIQIRIKYRYAMRAECIRKNLYVVSNRAKTCASVTHKRMHVNVHLLFEPAYECLNVFGSYVIHQSRARACASCIFVHIRAPSMCWADNASLERSAFV